MKWLGAIAFACLGVGALLFFPAHQEYTCFLNLTRFDHALNCSYQVNIHADAGIVSNGVWIDTEPLLRLFSEEGLHCPTTGRDYVLTFTVGEHPYCPVHGRLVERYDYHPHGKDAMRVPSTLNARLTRGLLLLLLGFLLGVTTVVAALVKLRRTQRKMAQPAHATGAASR